MRVQIFTRFYALFFKFAEHLVKNVAHGNGVIHGSMRIDEIDIEMSCDIAEIVRGESEIFAGHSQGT